MSRTVTVGLCSVDLPGLTIFDAFDPESFPLIVTINDALIVIDNEGAVQPSLATSWRRVSPVEMELTLRRGVTFHNGEPFDASSVVATYHALHHPTPSAGARGVLGVLTGVTRVDDFTVRITTAFPDAMLVRRLFIFNIYPRSVLERDGGRAALQRHPIGTGPYRFVSYERGHELVLERNPAHWTRTATVDRLRFPIVRQKEWVGRLARGELDLALGLDSHDRVRAGRIPGLVAASRPAAMTQFFLLANRGPLADVRVRRALNHALHRRLLTDVTTHGYGRPQRSLATEGTQGFTECLPYRYSPELARELLREAGHGDGIRLRGLVSETSTAVYFAVKELLGRAGVELEAEIVPRAEWLGRLVGAHRAGHPYDADFAVALFDNPILHTLFMHFCFLYSHGPFSLLHDDDYDARFRAAATTFDEAAAVEAQAALERHVRDAALLLFTVEEDVHAAWREGFSCDLPRSGLFQVSALTTIRAAPSAPASRTLPPPSALGPDLGLLLDATSHAGAFFLRPGSAFEQPAVQQIWSNVRVSEERWRLQNEPMLRELVSQVEARTSLATVLGSTARVAIVGYSTEGRRLFVNAGYDAMFGDPARPVFEHLGEAWEPMRARLRETGAWLGPVHLTSTGRPADAPDRVYLSVTVALDDDGLAMGYSFVFSDFSGEEERIRNQAIRTILDNVPYGLLMCDARGCVLDGYSDACARFFVPGLGVQGRPLTELLGMDARAAAGFQVAYMQIFADVLPEEVNLGNLPERVAVGARTLSLSGSVVRDGDGTVAAVLFTLIDISSLIEAEQEVEALRGAIAVASHRDRFEEFAQQLHHRLLELAAAAAAAGEVDQREARIELHTAKGVLGQFHLHALARQIHRIEDRVAIGAEDLRAVADALRALLERNARLWDIQLDHREPHYTVTEHALAALEARVAAAPSLEEARRAVAGGLEQLRRKPVHELIGPLEESCALLAERTGKRVRFVLDGGDLRWPSHLTSAFDVLAHLVRNAIDHGIEPPEERGGKDEVATIALRARAGDGRVEIALSDDGRGIDVDRVAARAVELGAITAADLAAMPAPARLQLIFIGGLSTADQITETSGRGVGMTAVQQAIRGLGGELTIESAPGRGTAFRIGFEA